MNFTTNTSLITLVEAIHSLESNLQAFFKKGYLTSRKRGYLKRGH